MNDFMLFLHLLAVIVAVGGMHFVLLVIGPTANRIGPPAGPEFAAAAHRKFRTLVWMSIAILLLTGMHLLFARSLLKTPNASLVVLKVLLALVVIGISLGLSLPLKALAGMQAKRLVWLRVNILIAAVVIFLGVYISRR